MKKVLITVLILGLVGIAGFIVKAANTNLSQTMSQGSKSVSSDASADFTGLTVSVSAQTATTSFAIDPQNPIGDGASYSVTMAVTNLATIGSVQTVAGSNSTLSTGGTYDGTYGVTSPVTRYEIVITKAGAVGTSEWKWRYSTTSASDWSATSTTGSGLTVEKGITVTFGTADYVVDDEWAFGVDVFPYTSLTVTPGTITADSGVTTGMTAGSEGTFAGTAATSDARNLITTEYYRGMGDYAQTESLSQSVHANPVAGTYSSVATITIL